MSVLINCPEDLIRSVLSEWLTLVEWRKLDTALTSTVLREPLLAMFQRIPCDSLDYNINNIQHYEWVYARNIVLTTLIVSEYYFKGGGLLFGVKFDNILKLYIRFTNIEHQWLMNSCPKMKSLIFLRCALTSLVNPTVLQRLELLHYESDHFPRDFSCVVGDMAMIRDHCHSLKSFRLLFEVDDEAIVNCFASIFRFNTQLTRLEVRITTSLARRIVEHCHSLTYLNARDSGLNVNTAVMLLTGCPSLQIFYYSGEAGPTVHYNRDQNLLSLVGAELDCIGWEDLIKLVPDIVSLHLCSFRVPVINTIITTVLLECKAVRSVELNFVPSLELTTLKNIFHCERLSELNIDLRGFDELVVETLKNLKSNLSKIIVYALSLSVSWVLTLLANNRQLSHCFIRYVTLRSNSDDEEKLVAMLQYAQNTLSSLTIPEFADGDGLKRALLDFRECRFPIEVDLDCTFE